MKTTPNTQQPYLSKCVPTSVDTFISRYFNVYIFLFNKMFRFGCQVALVLWHINLCRLFNAKSTFFSNYHFFFKQCSFAWIHSLIVKNVSISRCSVQIQIIHFSVSTVSVLKTVLLQKIHFSVSTVSMSKTVLFRAIQFCISMQFIFDKSV